MNINDLRARAHQVQAEKEPAAAEALAAVTKIAAKGIPEAMVWITRELEATADHGKTKTTMYVPVPSAVIDESSRIRSYFAGYPAQGVGSALGKLIVAELTGMGIKASALYDELSIGGPASIIVDVDFS